MHNMVYLIGRLTEEPQLVKYDDDKDKLTINLAVQRSFRNEEGLYETDFIRCVLWNVIASNTCEYCHKGDLVGIKGRIQTSTYVKDDETKYMTEVVVEKVSFLASKRSNDEKTDE